MLQFIQTNTADCAFQLLVQALNTELASRDGADHPLARYNTTTGLLGVVLVYQDGQAVGCGAISTYDAKSVEIKRMYVAPSARGKRIGERVLQELESWAKELGYRQSLLFMGSRQPEALRLYKNNGYQSIPSYGKLKGIPECRCFAKSLEE
ncbi:MAG: GNAT family N-acetyltransferase [Bacteroidota bacterium]